MACGVPVVSNRADCTEWLLNDDIAMLATPTVNDLADALEQVLCSSTLREQIKKNAFAFTESASWSVEGDKMVEGLEHILSHSAITTSQE
jgi:glycosyltransferase involved in cell wall biosynthesis